MSFIEKLYKKELFSRHDDNGTVFYFSDRNFPGLKKEPYRFLTKAGHRLTGYFYSYENPKEGRIVVFDHGMGVGHRAYLKEIEMLARHGYLVYSYDHTGCTESEGAGIRGFLGSLADLDACLTALKKDFPDNKFSVMGHSWGGFSTMNICAFHPDIAHAVALSGFTDLHTIQKEVIPCFLLPFRGRLVNIEREANPDYIDACALTALESTEARVLIIHSADDKTVSSKNSFDRLKKALSDKENIRFLTVSEKIITQPIQRKL